MNLLASFRSISARLRRGTLRRDVEDELRAHIALRADDLERTGLSRAEAERQARIEFGGFEKFREQSHEALGGHFARTFLQDLRYSLRGLRKSPGFVVTAIATLALAIGANAVAFSMLNGVFIRPLNVPHPRSLYALQRGNKTYAVQSYPDYLDLRDRNRSFQSLAAYSINQGALSEGGNPSSPWFYEVSGNYFDALGVRPWLGRFFHAADEQGANSAPYLVLTWAYWHSHFHGDSTIVGRVVRLNKHPFTILGVTPREFRGTLLFFTPDFFVPIVDQPEIAGSNCLDDRGNRCVFQVLGHLKSGVTPVQAGADLSSIAAWMHKTFPKADGEKSFSLVRPALGGNFFAPAARAFLAGLMLLAGLILLAACANLGSLFAARAADRGRDIALRLALGSSRGRILRQVFAEALLLSFAGGALGLAGSSMLLHRLSEWNPFPQFPIRIPVNPDGHVYAVALLLAVVSGCLFGAVPIRQVLGTDPYEVVKAGSAGAVGARRPVTVREVLLVVQIAICAVLVTGAIVAVRGMVRSLHSNFGFEPRNAMLANTELGMAGYTHDAIPGMQKQMLDAVREIPGVKAAGLVGPFQPLTMGGSNSDVFRDTTTDLKPANAVDSPYQYDISPGYFQAAGTVLLAGRAISLHDGKDAPRVAVINPRLARDLFGSDRAVVGRHFKLQDGTRVEVVGVAEEGKYFSLTEAPQPAMFLPILQSPTSQTWIVVRSPIHPQQLAMAIRGKLHGLDPALPLFIQPWATEMDGALFAARVAVVWLGILGLIGALLSFTGIFGMAAFSISRRLREIGIRMALGAQRIEVLQTALGRALRLLAFGSVAGMLLGLLTAQVLGHIVYQASPRDPLVMGGVVLVMLLLGLAATWIPAQRALSIDPLVLLRED
jgi:predicted permease